MKRQLHWLLLGAALLCFAFEAVVWASAAQLPGTGVHLFRSAKREAPLVYAYMLAGRPMTAVAPLRDFGEGYALQVFLPLADQIQRTPELAMDLAFAKPSGPRHSTLKMFHHAPLVLLVAWLIAYAMRPKAVHMLVRR